MIPSASAAAAALACRLQSRYGRRDRDLPIKPDDGERLAEMRTLERFDPFGPPMHVDRFGGLWSFGGYAAVSFDLARWVRFFIRAELEAAILEAANHPIELIPVLSTSLSFS